MAPSFTYQNPSRREGGRVLCIDCGVLGANCTADNVKQTITCSVNTTACNYQLCDTGASCFLVFSGHPTWKFSATCFAADLQDECILEGTDRTDASFPPRLGIFCQCNDIEKCSLDKPLVYVHPSQSVQVSDDPTHDALPLPTLLPSSPSPTSQSGDCDYILLPPSSFFFSLAPNSAWTGLYIAWFICCAGVAD